MIRGMIVDGNNIAKEIIADVRKRVDALSAAPRLCVITVGDNAVTKNFLSVKEQKARDAGISVSIRRFPEDTTNEELIDAIRQAEEESIIVQLPLPSHIDRTAVLNSIPVKKDPDVLSAGSRKAFEAGDLSSIPPVVGAVAEILKRNNISPHGKKAVVLGKGMLVGAPIALWLEHEGAHVRVLDHESGDISDYTRAADIIVSGVGRSNLIRPDMIRDGVVLLDAGTSEAEGELKGDADPACATKCSLFTPVPGGIGPVTISMLLQNIVTLAEATPASD